MDPELKRAMVVEEGLLVDNSWTSSEVLDMKSGLYSAHGLHYSKKKSICSRTASMAISTLGPMLHSKALVEIVLFPESTVHFYSHRYSTPEILESYSFETNLEQNKRCA